MVQNIFSTILQLNIIHQIVLGVALLSFAIILYYYLSKFFSVTSYHLSKKVKVNESMQPTSVVVVIKDDIDFLDKGIHALMSQKYDAPFQVVIVNYKSQCDTTTTLLDALKKQYPELYVTGVIPTPNFRHTTKLAYTIGVKAAIYENVIFLSPIATVNSDKWLQLASRGFEYSSIITGYARITPHRNFLNALSRSHNIITSLLYMGKLTHGHPYMATEQFLGYTKKLFFKCKGFSTYLRLNRGENDIFIQNISQHSRVSLVLNPKSTVEIESTKGFRNYITNCSFVSYSHRYYDFGSQLYMFSYNLFTLLFWGSSIFLLLATPMVVQIMIGVVVFVKLVLLCIIAYKLSKRTKEKVSYINLIFYDLISPFETMLIWILNRACPSNDLWI
ncbi:MAG: hypothetical protein RR388_05035 [Rikenellaceae bacterium]